MDITGIGSIFEFGSKVIDKLFPDKTEALDSKWARSDSPARAQRVAHMLGRGA